MKLSAAARTLPLWPDVPTPYTETTMNAPTITDQAPLTTNGYNEPLPTDPKVLQARIDALVDILQAHQATERGLLDVLRASVAEPIVQEEVDGIVATRKFFLEMIYAEVGANHSLRTGEDLFQGDTNPVGE